MKLDTLIDDIYGQLSALSEGREFNLSEEDLVDYSEYDEEGNLIVGSKKSMSEEERKIKERAAKSEYNERTDMDRGIYS